MKIQFRINLQIENQEQLREAAYKAALREFDGNETLAKEYLDPNLMSINECLVMLFDPGISPLGCKIISSYAA